MTVRRSAAAVSVALAGAALISGIVTVGVTARRVLTAERRQRKGTAGSASGDALLVLGARALPDRPSRELQARLDHAVARWQAGAAPVICVSGGLDGPVDEAHVMADYVVGCGVPSSAVRRVVPGENTRASMRAMAAAAPHATVVAVSSPYHAHRIVAEGRRCGLTVLADCPASTPENENPEIRRTRLVGEIVGCILYASPERTIVVARLIAVPARRTLPRLAARVGAGLRRIRNRV